MSLIKFDYTPALYIDPVSKKELTIYRPLVPVRISYNHKVTQAPVRSLADSGADYNLFPSSWGEYMGIRLDKGISVEIMGIGGLGIKAFRHTLKLYIGTYNFTAKVDFSPYQTIPLLGREGFFNHFKRVSFFEKDKYCELEY